MNPEDPIISPGNSHQTEDILLPKNQQQKNGLKIIKKLLVGIWILVNVVVIVFFVIIFSSPVGGYALLIDGLWLIPPSVTFVNFILMSVYLRKCRRDQTAGSIKKLVVLIMWTIFLVLFVGSSVLSVWGLRNLRDQREAMKPLHLSEEEVVKLLQGCEISMLNNEGEGGIIVFPKSGKYQGSYRDSLVVKADWNWLVDEAKKAQKKCNGLPEYTDNYSTIIPKWVTLETALKLIKNCEVTQVIKLESVDRNHANKPDGEDTGILYTVGGSWKTLEVRFEYKTIHEEESNNTSSEPHGININTITDTVNAQENCRPELSY